MVIVAAVTFLFLKGVKSKRDRSGQLLRLSMEERVNEEPSTGSEGTGSMALRNSKSDTILGGRLGNQMIGEDESMIGARLYEE